jgi:hypothetical protein
MVRSCRVTIKDMQDVSHTVEVTAESLYEAVALGLKAIRGRDWVEGLPDQFKVGVSVSEIPVRHFVEMKEFNAWIAREGGKPRDLVQRKRARKILGLPETR